MALAKKITKIGNSYGVILPSDIMELVGITPESEIEITVDKGGLIIHPTRKEDKIISDSFNKFVNQFSDTLQKLA